MKHFYLPAIIILFMLPAVAVADPIDNIADLIRQGNIHELANLFAPSVNVTILDDENIYTKLQAEGVLEKFFSLNKPRTVKILHKITSNPSYKFGVVIVTTEKGTFRIAYTLKETNGSFLLIEMRIEMEKVK
jgi:hypothetical protein